MTIKLDGKLAFLKSTRFWAIVIGAVALALSQEGIISSSIAQMITTIVGGYATVRTIDKFTTFTDATQPYIEQTSPIEVADTEVKNDVN